jgi:hypothetical protein
LKKAISIIIFFIVSVTCVCALELPLSAGLGGLLDYGYANIGADHKSAGLTGKMTYSALNYGIFTYLDARYVSIGLGFSGISTTIKTDEALHKSNGGIDPENITVVGNALILSLYGKFPFAFERYTIYPLLGIEGQIVLSMLYGEDSPEGWDNKKQWDSYQGTPHDWDAFWFRVGAGCDFFLGEAFFIRGELTFGIKANTAREKLIVDNLAANGNYDNISAWGIGGKLTVSVGFTFSSLDFAGLGDFGGGGGGGSSGGGGADNIYYPR